MRPFWKAAVVLLIILLANPFSAIAEEAKKEPKTFKPEYGRDPYELVITAEKYREEFEKEKIESESWRAIYFEKALDLYKEALHQDPYFAYAYLSRGFLYVSGAVSRTYKDRADEFFQRASENMQKAAEIVLNYEEAHYQLAQLAILRTALQGKNLLDKAFSHLEKYVLSGGKKDSYYYAWLSYAYMLKKDKSYYFMIDESLKAITRLKNEKIVKWAQKVKKSNYSPSRNNIPPLRPPVPPRKEWQPSSIRTSVAVLDFANRAGPKAKRLAEIMPILLEMALFDGGRFNVVAVKRGLKPEYADKDAGLSPIAKMHRQFGYTSSSKEDALIFGDIMRIDPSDKTFIVNIKAVHARTGYILYAASERLKYRMLRSSADSRGTTADIPYKEIVYLANRIASAFSREIEGRIIHIKGKYVSVNLGAEQGIRKGMEALVLGKGREVVDRFSKEKEVLDSSIYTGEIVFERVKERVSEARILGKGRISIRIGDIVKLK